MQRRTQMSPDDVRSTVSKKHRKINLISCKWYSCETGNWRGWFHLPRWKKAILRDCKAAWNLALGDTVLKWSFTVVVLPRFRFDCFCLFFTCLYRQTAPCQKGSWSRWPVLPSVEECTLTRGPSHILGPQVWDKMFMEHFNIICVLQLQCQATALPMKASIVLVSYLVCHISFWDRLSGNRYQISYTEMDGCPSIQPSFNHLSRTGLSRLDFS